MNISKISKISLFKRALEFAQLRNLHKTANKQNYQQKCESLIDRFNYPRDVKVAVQFYDAVNSSVNETRISQNIITRAIEVRKRATENNYSTMHFSGKEEG